MTRIRGRVLVTFTILSVCLNFLLIGAMIWPASSGNQTATAPAGSGRTFLPAFLGNRPMGQPSRPQTLEKVSDWFSLLSGGPQTAKSGPNPDLDYFAERLEDAPAPKERLKDFDHFLAPTSEYRILSWHVWVRSATRNNGGWQVKALVRPNLGKRGGGGRLLFTPQATTETWQINDDGTTAALKVIPDNSIGRGAIISG